MREIDYKGGNVIQHDMLLHKFRVPNGMSHASLHFLVFLSQSRTNLNLSFDQRPTPILVTISGVLDLHERY